MSRDAFRFAVCLMALAAAPGPGVFSPGAPKARFPLDQPAGLVASFGEYRPDHLHPGVDFSTGGRNGLPVHAVEAGEIFRLKVEWRGYGRALYIRHADGRISVYAHLERYEDGRLGLERRVAAEKRRRGLRYPGDIFLDPPVPVRQGEIVGFSGESGAGLPHLHFEIRREDQEPSDPLAPGWIADSLPPIFRSVILKADSADTWIDGHREVEIPLAPAPGGTYAPTRVPVVSGPFLPEARVFAETRNGHRLGIKSLQVRVDGVLTYDLRLASFRFSQYPEVGLLLDHSRSRMSPPDYAYFLARLRGNDLGVVPGTEAAWPLLSPGEHRMEVGAESAPGGSARAVIPFRVVSPVAVRWEDRSPVGSPHTLRFGSSRALLGSGLRISYRTPGQRDPVPCRERKELVDGETCSLALPPGAAEVTADVFTGSLLLGRATRFFPASPDLPRVAPSLAIEPFRSFVDLHFLVGEGKAPPARVVLTEKQGTTSIPLVEVAPSELLGTAGAEAWKVATAIGLEWETSAPAPAREAEAELSPHYGRVDSSLDLRECGIRFHLDAGSLYDDSPLQCENPASLSPPGDGMALLGAGVRLLPEGTPLARKGLLSFPLPSDSHPERLGIYRLGPDGHAWRYEGGEARQGEIRLPVGRLGTFALLRDDSPPRILGVEPSGSRASSSPRPVFRARVEERGSGLNFDGVHLSLDGREMETEYDPDRGWSTSIPAAPMSRGTHKGKAWAVDRAGNRSAILAFEVRVP